MAYQAAGPRDIHPSARPWQPRRRYPQTINGEAVWCDGGGLAIVDKLHGPANDGKVMLYAFDLLEINGEEWRRRALESGRRSSPCSSQGRRPNSTSPST